MATTEKVPVAGARVDDRAVAGGVDYDVAAPRPLARVLEHRQQQQVFEPHHGQLRPARGQVERPPLEDARAQGDLAVARQVAQLRDLDLHPFVVLGVHGHDPAGPVVEVEDEDGVERPEAVEVRGVEPAGRVGEAHLGHGPRCVRPPGAHGPVGSCEVGGQVAEQVEGQRRRPQQVGPAW